MGIGNNLRDQEEQEGVETEDELMEPAWEARRAEGSGSEYDDSDRMVEH